MSMLSIIFGKTLSTQYGGTASYFTDCIRILLDSLTHPVYWCNRDDFDRKP